MTLQGLLGVFSFVDEEGCGMARQSLSPMKGLDDNPTSTVMNDPVLLRRKRKDLPMTHLKYLRKKSGYTLESLSELTSISISYLSRLESGSRRLNTDLIRRLSHAFKCDPAELLEEKTHESQVISGVEFSRRRSPETIIKDRSLPLYSVTKNEETGELAIRICSPSEWRQCPVELAGRGDVFALYAGEYLEPYFNSSSTVYLEPATNLAPESTVIILNCGKIMVKKIWSVTPTSLQLCDMTDIEEMKKGHFLADKLIEVDRTSTEVVYKVVGYANFDLR